MKRIRKEEWRQDVKETLEPSTLMFRAMADKVYLEEYTKGEAIIVSGETLTTLRYIIEGKAKISIVHEDGRESIVDFLGKGDYIGDLTFLEMEKRTKDVAAITDCRCLCVPMNEAIVFLREDNDFLLSLSKYLADKHLRRTWFYVKGLRYELKNRLAAYILMTSDGSIYYQKHTMTAEFLGISYRHLLHTFKIFKENGWIRKEKNGYWFDKEVLEELAKDIIY